MKIPKSGLMKKAICVLLTAALLLGSAVVTASAGEAETGGRGALHFAEFGFAADERVKAIVVLEGDAVLGCADLQDGEEAELAEKLLRRQDKLIDRLDGSVRVLGRYAWLFNGFAVEAAAGELEALERMSGVRKVYLCNEYTIPEEKEGDALNATHAAEVTGAAALHDLGYYGDGIVVAILDSGFNLDHEALLPNELMKHPKLTQQYVESIETNGAGRYYNEKFPFVYDYYDHDDDPTDNHGHGSHVAGIAGGYVKDKFCGAAPAAQFLGMKVSNDSGSGIYAYNYFNGLEDACRLGADVITCSFGSPNGFSFDDDLETELFGNVYQTLTDAGIATFFSAGNEATMIKGNKSWWELMGYAEATGVSALPTWCVDYGALGSPASYLWNIGVASAYNPIVTSTGIAFSEGGAAYRFDDPYEDQKVSEEGPGLNFRANFEGRTFPFHYIDGLGTEEDFAGLDLTGKIVSVLRGTVSFQDKINRAAAAGAVGVIIIDNQPELSTSMAVTENDAPAILIAMAAGEELKALDGGEITVSFALSETPSSKAYLIAEDSSRGCNADLAFKPQITGIGKNVYSCACSTDDGYVIMSGTSMATPNVAGSFAVMLEYLQDSLLDFLVTKPERMRYAESLLYSTASVLTNEQGYAYSPRTQGAGLADIVKALSSEIYITDPLLSTGDHPLTGDPETDGVFTLKYEVVNRTLRRLELVPRLTVVADVPAYAKELEAYYNTGISADAEALLGEDFLSVRYTVNHLGLFDQTDGYVTLYPGETVTLTAEVRADPETVREYIGEAFPYGFFLDGFLGLYDRREVEKASEDAPQDAPKELCHGSFISFIGDWTEAPAMSPYSLLDVVDLLNDPDSYVGSEQELGYYYYDLELPTDVNVIGTMGTNGRSVYYPGMNLFQSVESASEIGILASSDYFCFSSYASDADQIISHGIVIMPSLLRNLRSLSFVVSDAATGQVYTVENDYYWRKDAYDYESDSFYSENSFTWDGTDSLGVLLPSGTEVMIDVYTTIDCDRAVSRKELSFTATLDYKAPEVFAAYDPETGLLTVRAQDETMLAALGVADEEGNDLGCVAFDGAEGDAVHTVTFDLNGRLPEGSESVSVYAGDYATNVREIVIPLDGSYESEFPVEMLAEPCEGATVGTARLFLYESNIFTVGLEEGYCRGEDYAVTVLQGGTPVEAEYLFEKDGTEYYRVKAYSDEPVTVSVTGVGKHEPAFVETVAPTCTTGGCDVYRCANCGQTEYRNETQPASHTPGQAEITREPTYTEDGERIIRCAVCGEVISTEAIPAWGVPDGDVNGDGSVNAIDYLLVKSFVLGIRTPGEEEKRRADMNMDGELNSIDYFLVKREVLAV